MPQISVQAITQDRMRQSSFGANAGDHARPFRIVDCSAAAEARPIEVFTDVSAEVRTLVVPEGGELPPEEELEAMEAAEKAAEEAEAEAVAEQHAEADAEVEQFVAEEEAAEEEATAEEEVAPAEETESAVAESDEQVVDPDAEPS